MALVPSWPVAAACLLAGALLGAGADHLWVAPKVADRDAQIAKMNLDHREELRVREVKRGDDEREARAKERELTARAGQIEQEKINEVAKINARLADALGRLQSRPDRQPAAASGVPQAATACQGSTGAELSRQDGGFLNGEAARANEIRAALGACYQAYDSVAR